VVVHCLSKVVGVDSSCLVGCGKGLFVANKSRSVARAHMVFAAVKDAFGFGDREWQ
jgi:hypothetical protein